MDGIPSSSVAAGLGTGIGIGSYRHSYLAGSSLVLGLGASDVIAILVHCYSFLDCSPLILGTPVGIVLFVLSSLTLGVVLAAVLSVPTYNADRGTLVLFYLPGFVFQHIPDISFVERL